jgi:hypothetical protein
MFGNAERKFFLLGTLLVSFGSQLALAQKLVDAGASSVNRTATSARRPADAWVPPDIDAAKPALISSAPCALGEVVAGAGRQVQTTVENLDRFTAIESVQHRSVSGSGKLGTVQPRTFDYLVAINRVRDGYLSMEEYRTQLRRARTPYSEQFPGRIATEGTPILVLVFHPSYARDFDMKCEGLGAWRGQPAWLVRFEQRAGVRRHLSNIVIKNKLYGVRLRGRAWILADSYQVARLETDLAETIPEIKLRIERIDVEYRPVRFSERQTELWLPSTAELYMDFADRRFYRKHSFTDFTLFSVDVQQQFASKAP